MLTKTWELLKKFEKVQYTKAIGEEALELRAQIESFVDELDSTGFSESIAFDEKQPISNSNYTKEHAIRDFANELLKLKFQPSGLLFYFDLATSAKNKKNEQEKKERTFPEVFMKLEDRGKNDQLLILTSDVLESQAQEGKNNYDDALMKLYNTILRGEIGNKVDELIDQIKKLKLIGAAPVSELTTVLKETYELLNHAITPETLERYNKKANELMLKPSFWRKALGGAMLFLSAVIIVVGILAITGGTLIPVLGWPAGAGIIAAGLITFYAGVKQFSSETPLSKSMNNVFTAVSKNENYNLLQSLHPGLSDAVEKKDRHASVDNDNNEPLIEPKI